MSALAARVVEPGRVGRCTGHAATSFANGLDRLLGAVRAAVGECQRLLKADGVKLVVAGVAACKRFAFDLIESSLVIEHGRHVVAAVRPRDGELTAIDPV